MSVSIESVGQGPDLALIHGWGIGAGAWDELLPLLTPHLRVHRVALPGYQGSAAERMQRSSWPGTPGNPHAASILAMPPGKAPLDALSSPSPEKSANPAKPANPADFVATAATIAESLPAGCTLCGWSLGGELALQAALIAPQRVGRLILCAATPAFVQHDGWPHAPTPALLDSFAAALADDAAATLQRFCALLNHGDRRARASTRTLAAAATVADSAALQRGLDWLRDVDLRAAIAAIARPTLATLIIHGEHDPLIPLAAARWLATTLADAELEIFAGAAHAPFVSDPQRFARLLVDFCHAPTLTARP